jgi:hypothetical protein
MAVDHFGVVLTVPRGVHCELEVFETVILGEEGHEGAEGVRGRSVVGEDLCEVWFPALRAGDVLWDRDGEGSGVVVGEGHLDVVDVEVCKGRGGGRGDGRSFDGEGVRVRFARDHNAPPEVFVDAAGGSPALLVEAFAGTVLRQLDGEEARGSSEPSDGGRGKLLMCGGQHRAGG